MGRAHTAEQPGRVGRRRGRLPLVLVAAGLALGGGFGLWLTRADRSGGPSDTTERTELATDPTADTNAVYPVLGDDRQFNNLERQFVPVAPLDGFAIGRRDGATVRDVVVVWMDDPTKVLSTAKVSPQAPSETLHIGQRDVTLSRKFSAGTTPLDDTYEWEEGGVRVSVVGGTAAPTVVAALTVTAGDGGPRLTLAELPDGLQRLVPPTPSTGPSSAASGPISTVEFGASRGETELIITVDEGGPLMAGQEYDVVGVNGGEGFRTSWNGLLMLDWPLPDSVHWAHMTAYGLDEEEVVRTAAGITFTDRSGWLAWYPAMEEQLDLVGPDATAGTTTPSTVTAITAAVGPTTSSTTQP